MRTLLLLAIVLIISACDQTDAGKELVLTIASPSDTSPPDLEVTHVALRWSQVWQCGVDVHITITNHSPTPVNQFTLSLHDRRETIIGIAGDSERTVIVSVSGEEMARWMDASGTVDVDNVIDESDETNNDYRHPLPYSAVPGMESIAICNATKNAPTPTATATKRPYPLDATILPPAIPNLRILSIQNTYVPTDCWVNNGEGNRHVVWVEFVNDGYVPIEEYTIRFNGEDTTYTRISAGESRRTEFTFTYTNNLRVELDPFNDIAELYEDDNIMERIPLTFTPPPHCTKTPTISPT